MVASASDDSDLDFWIIKLKLADGDLEMVHLCWALRSPRLQGDAWLLPSITKRISAVASDVAHNAHSLVQYANNLCHFAPCAVDDDMGAHEVEAMGSW